MLTQDAARPDLPTSLRVLVVDDDESVLDAICSILTGLMTIDMAAIGHEAMRKLSECDYDVVISDLRMPGLSGSDLYRWLKERRPGAEARIIFVTGDTFDPAMEAFLKETGATCLGKPFRIGALLNAISKVASQVVAGSAAR